MSVEPPQIRQRTVAKAHTLIEALPFIREHDDHARCRRGDIVTAPVVEAEEGDLALEAFAAALERVAGSTEWAT